MRLTIVNLFKKLPNGNIFSGKHKLPKKIRYWMRRELVEDIQREEKNMLYLRHHYLSHEQINNYRWELGKHEEYYKKIITAKKSNTPKNVTIEHHLGILREKDSWETYK